jgi:hypothetical protein
VAFYQFDTAWSPPLPVIQAASNKFLAVRLTLRYYEGGCGFKGILVCKAGQVLRNECGEYRGRRGG